MAHAEPLAGANHSGKDFLRDFGGIEFLFFAQANITPTTRFFLPLLPEIFQQELATATLKLAELYHLRQFLLSVFPFYIVYYLVDEEVLPYLVAVRVKKHTFAGQAVASRPPGLLIISFQRFGQVVMDYQPDVGLVYAHTKGYGRNNNGHFIMGKFFLGF